MIAATAVMGCTTRSHRVPNPLEIAEVEYTRLFDAAVVTLRSRGYVVDRQDYRFGVITTRPVFFPTIFEPWHSTNSTWEQAQASTINHQRRQIAITLEPVPSDETPPADDAAGPVTLASYILRAEVVVERLAVPRARLTGSTSGGRVMGRLAAVPEEWRRRGIESHYWRPIGRDPYLERRLVEAIVRRSLQ